MDFATVRSRFSPLGWVLKSSDESGQAMLDFDFRRAGPERLTIQVGKDQAGLGAERQSNFLPFRSFCVLNLACFDENELSASLL